MFDCVVCRYWSERLEEAGTHSRAKSALKQERSLMVALRLHQSGACAYRFPDLLSDLVKQSQNRQIKLEVFAILHRQSMQ
jgi:hypothetical protein